MPLINIITGVITVNSIQSRAIENEYKKGHASFNEFLQKSYSAKMISSHVWKDLSCKVKDELLKLGYNEDIN